MKSLNGQPVIFYVIVVLAMVIATLNKPAHAATDKASKQSFSVEQTVDGAAPSGVKPQKDTEAKTKLRTQGLRHFDNYAFYVYDADVDLFYDDDRDGHYYGLRIVFDADTDYPLADVYARLYLSYEGGPWEHYYTTDTFLLLGNSGIDDYVVETELFSGYPTGYYDLLIELYDADYGDYLAAYGPEESSEMSFLPLEDQIADQSGGIIITPPQSLSNGGGGSLGLFSILGLLGLVGRLSRRNSR